MREGDSLSMEDRGILNEDVPSLADAPSRKRRPFPRGRIAVAIAFASILLPIAILQQMFVYEYAKVSGTSDDRVTSVRQKSPDDTPRVSIDRSGLEAMFSSEGNGDVISGDSLDPAAFSSYEIKQVAEINHCQDVSYVNGFLFAPWTGVDGNGIVSVYDVANGFAHLQDMVIPATPTGSRPHCNSMEFGPSIAGEEFPLLYCHSGGGNAIVYRITRSGETFSASYVCRQYADIGSLIGIDRAKSIYCAFNRAGQMRQYKLNTGTSDFTYRASDAIKEARTVVMPIMTQGAFCSGGALWIAHGLHEGTPYVGIYEMDTGEVLNKIDMTPYDTAEAEGLTFWDGDLYYISIQGRVWQIHPTGIGTS